MGLPGHLEAGLMDYNPFDGDERRALQLQLLIGIQHAIYETFGMAVTFACSFLIVRFVPEVPYLPLIIAVPMFLTVYRHITRLTRLSSNLEAKLDQRQG